MGPPRIEDAEAFFTLQRLLADAERNAWPRGSLGLEAEAAKVICDLKDALAAV